MMRETSHRAISRFVLRMVVVCHHSHQTFQQRWRRGLPGRFSNVQFTNDAREGRSGSETTVRIRSRTAVSKTRIAAVQNMLLAHIHGMPNLEEVVFGEKSDVKRGRREPRPKCARGGKRRAEKENQKIHRQNNGFENFTNLDSYSCKRAAKIDKRKSYKRAAKIDKNKHSDNEREPNEKHPTAHGSRILFTPVHHPIHPSPKAALAYLSARSTDTQK